MSTVVVSRLVRSAVARAERAFKAKSERGMVAREMSSIRLDDFQKKKMTSTSKSAVGLFDPFL